MEVCEAPPEEPIPSFSLSLGPFSHDGLAVSLLSPLAADDSIRSLLVAAASGIPWSSPH